MSTATDYLNSPFARMTEVPRFTLASPDIADGEAMDAPLASKVMGVPGGQDRSPELTWSDVPEGTQAFALTCYDPDAPSGSGFWHWIVTDIPADVTTLARDAGNPETGELPEGSTVIRNDAGMRGFIGAAPPAGHGPHRYFFIVHALKEPLNLDPDATGAMAGFNINAKSIGRAWIEATFEVK